ncbi:YsnF/AvaK domain-containing protein [Lederbergia citrea]|uniref:YsnF/AvaK domain-containing protein n=1 Tax=Lederbergia citrea TaxID=2833581 RepID=UPI001BC92129|nr:YsnF/AvaK domain-containing protein [Lederbergia citrea]MBS4204919.1 YsnF/AvaK domain-containing protein [Lederbergia citrea]
MDNKTFIGTFHTEEEAINKIQELKSQGYDGNDIYAIAKDDDDISMVRGRTDAEVQSTGGNWIDRFISFLSGEEPVRGALRNMGLSDADADRYYGDIESGKILLYVDKEYGNLYASGSNIVTEADENLGPDPLNRETNYDQSQIGSNDFEKASDEVAAGSYGVDEFHRDVDEEKKLKLHEEKLHVDKERVQSGEVSVEKHVVEEEQKVDIPISREEVYVERRPVNGADQLDETAATFDEDGENIHIPITEERIEVTKKPVVNEEIVIGKREYEDTETVNETVRREEADIDRSGGSAKEDSHSNAFKDQPSVGSGSFLKGEANSARFSNKTTLGEENESYMNESDSLRSQSDDISQQAKIDEELEDSEDDMQKRDTNPYIDHDNPRNRF